jgi:hypothetical protein
VRDLPLWRPLSAQHRVREKHTPPASAEAVGDATVASQLARAESAGECSGLVVSTSSSGVRLTTISPESICSASCCAQPERHQSRSDGPGRSRWAKDRNAMTAKLFYSIVLDTSIRFGRNNAVTAEAGQACGFILWAQTNRHGGMTTTRQNHLLLWR